MGWWVPIVIFGPGTLIVTGAVTSAYMDDIVHRVANLKTKKKAKKVQVNAIEDLYKWKMARRRNDRAEWNAAYEALLNEIYPPKTYHRHKAIDPIEQMRRRDWDEYNDRAGFSRTVYSDEPTGPSRVPPADLIRKIWH